MAKSLVSCFFDSRCRTDRPYHVDNVVLKTGRRIAVSISGVIVKRTDEVNAVVKINFYRQTVATQLEPTANSGGKINIISPYSKARGVTFDLVLRKACGQIYTV